jgi:hypothetical protein
VRSVNTCCNKVDAGPWNLHALLLDPGHLLGVHLPRDVVVADKDYLLVVSSPFLKKKIVSDVFHKTSFYAKHSGSHHRESSRRNPQFFSVVLL